MTTPSMEAAEAQKARGAFYTPAAITGFLARWAVRTPDDRCLEPSCGDGAFVASLADRYAVLGRVNLSDSLYGVELEQGEVERAQAQAPTASIRTASFFDVEPGDIPTVTAVVG